MNRQVIDSKVKEQCKLHIGSLVRAQTRINAFYGVPFEDSMWLEVDRWLLPSDFGMLSPKHGTILPSDFCMLAPKHGTKEEYRGLAAAYRQLILMLRGILGDSRSRGLVDRETFETFNADLSRKSQELKEDEVEICLLYTSPSPRD